MCMSLDGFVAQPDENPAELFDWYWNGDVVVPSAQEGMTFSVDAASAPVLQDLTSGCGADRRPSAVRPDRRLGRQPPCRGTIGRRDPPAAAEARRIGFNGPPSPAASRRRLRRRRSSLATSSSRSPVPRSSSRRSTSASSTELCISQVPVLFGSGIRYSASSAAATSCSRTPSWCRAPGRSTSATPCDADGRRRPRHRHRSRRATARLRTTPAQSRGAGS